MSLDFLEKTSSNAPATASIIWLHGLGANGYDFYPIVDELNLSDLPIRFIFPHAPVIPVSINNHMAMPAWYDIKQLDLVRQEDDAGIRASAKAISDLIAQERAKGIAANRIILAGFSQGCAMTLHTALRHSETLAGLIALSGYLPLADSFLTERHVANQNTPIFMAHGEFDPVVPLARASASKTILEQAGYALQWHTYPMEHSVHPQEIQAIAQFIRRVLA